MKKARYAIALLLLAHSGFAQTPVIDSLQRIVARHSRDTNEINAFNRLAVEFNRRDLDKSKACVYQAITLARALKTTYGLSAAFSQLTTSHQNTGFADSARYYLHKLETLHKENPGDKTFASNFNMTAGLYYKNQGDPRKALPFMIRSLDFLTSKDKTSRAGQLLNIGNTYFNLGEIKNAAVYHLQSLALFEEVKNKRGESFCLQSLGNDFFELKDLKKAKTYYLRSMSIKEELNDNRSLITAWGAMGKLEAENKNFAVAESYILKALSASKELTLVQDEMRAYYDLALIEMNQEKTKEAHANFSKSLALAKQTGDSAWSTDIRTELAAIISQSQKKQNVESSLLKNILVSQEVGDRNTLARTHYNLAQHYALQRDFEKAYGHLEKFNAIDDSLRGGEVLVQIRQLEEKYNNDKKEKEIMLLKKNQELQSAEAERQKAVQWVILIALVSIIMISILLINRTRVISRAKRHEEIEHMRNSIARDLHDDIGSTLSSITILSRVAMSQQGVSTSPHFQKIADHSSRMMESMSDIVWSINPGNDSLDKVFVKMKEFTAEILEPKNIAYQFTGEESFSTDSLNLEKRKNLFLIFKEAVNNAAKYSQATLVLVKIQRTDNIVVLSIKDNGRGFDTLNVRRGNGLKNMQERAHAMRGHSDFISKEGEGTEIVIQMPLT